ncbi:ketoacyl-ACP synthase III [bacterium]|nr:ketoacyl-ACP synthase III [bacterium]
MSHKCSDASSGYQVLTARNRVIGTGSALPSRQVTNRELSTFLDTDDQWIEDRVGIRSRYVCAESESTVSLAVAAAQQALNSAGIEADEIELVVLGTFTPERSLPSVAALVAEALDIQDVAAFDIQAACSGFLFSFATAEALMSSLGVRTALVIGADTLSRVVDWSDRNTAVLFGDGAGACILQRPEGVAAHEAKPAVLSSYLRTFAEGAELITCEEIERKGEQRVSSLLGERGEKGPFLQMKGRSVFKAGVQLMTASIFQVLKSASLSIEEVSLFIPHQSNIRMIESVAENIDLKDQTKIATTIDEVGNTSAASIPITLDRYAREGRISRGDILLLTAVGSGISYGSLLLRW